MSEGKGFGVYGMRVRSIRTYPTYLGVLWASQSFRLAHLIRKERNDFVNDNNFMYVVSSIGWVIVAVWFNVHPNRFRSIGDWAIAFVYLAWYNENTHNE